MHLSPCYCINIRNASGIMTKIYDEHLMPYGITIRQYSIMKNLGKLGEASVTVLADYLGLERTSVVRMLRPLRQKGYINDAAAAGKRDRRLSLSDEGKILLASAASAWQAAQDEIERKIGKKNVENLMKIIEAL